MSGCLVRVWPSPMPHRLLMLDTHAVAFQPVNESGYFTFTVATPCWSVTTSGCQKTVERKSLRTCTAAPCCSPADTDLAAGVSIESSFICLPLIGKSLILYSLVLSLLVIVTLSATAPMDRKST